MFLEHQINILERFLKDHVTLKTGEFSFDHSFLNILQYYILFPVFLIK